MYKKRLFTAILLIGFLFSGITPAIAQDDLTPPLPGTVEGTGTYFEVTDSEYLNVTLESTEPLDVTLESVPQMVVMHLEAAEGATSAQITLGGFTPSTTYYKYEDDYHNEVIMTTDANGSYTYSQDLSSSHLVFIQPNPSTYFIKDDATGGHCNAIGTWDFALKTCTLTTNVYASIQIDSNYLMLDGAGYTVSGQGTGYGIYLSNRTGVTVKNSNVEGFHAGIFLYGSNNNTLEGNTASNNLYGILLNGSSNNTLTGNTASSNNLIGIFLVNYSNSNTLEGNTASNNDSLGIYLYAFSNNNTLTGNTTNLNNDYGIHLYYYSNNNTLTGNTANLNNDFGIYLFSSSNNTLEGNTASNNLIGIYLFSSSNNTLTGNTANLNNYYGIYLASSSNNTLTGNTANLNNDYGICLGFSSNNTLTGNTMSENNYNFGIQASSVGYFNHSIDTTNTVDGKPIYYVVGASDEVYDSSTNAGVFYAINCRNITIRDLTLNNNYYGVVLVGTQYSTVENINVLNNYHAIYLFSSSNNTLTGNTANLNNYYGIYLYYSNNNTLVGNTASSNYSYGIYLYTSSNNEIYNNNFVGNSIPQAHVVYSSGNLFNLPWPIGGNYWSDWTSPDSDGDYFVDSPYVFDFGGQDHLPWVVQDGWMTPTYMIEQLQNEVIELNLHHGIENSLDVKLEAVKQALDDLNENNDVAAINALVAFINAVEAQRGKEITEADADALVASAQAIIAAIESQ